MKIMRFLFATLTILISFNSFALTEADCRTRVNNAMHNSDKLGGNDADAYRWAQNAANECFKEMSQSSSSTSTSSKGNSSDTGFGIISWLITIIFISLIIYFSYLFLNDYFRNATIQEMKDFLNRDMIINKHLPVTEKILEIQKQKKDFYHSKLDAAIAGECNYKWRDLGVLIEDCCDATNQIVFLGSTAQTWAAKKKKK